MKILNLCCLEGNNFLFLRIWGLRMKNHTIYSNLQIILNKSLNGKVIKQFIWTMHESNIVSQLNGYIAEAFLSQKTSWSLSSTPKIQWTIHLTFLHCNPEIKRDLFQVALHYSQVENIYRSKEALFRRSLVKQIQV